MIAAGLALAGLAALVAAAPLVAEARRKRMGSAARRGADGNFARLSQGITFYRWIGPVRGPVAVCVHGLTTPSFVWGGVAQGLAQMGFRVLVYDLYGRGMSDRPPGPQDRAFFLRQLDELLQDQGIKDDITLVGYSMGGAIATGFAAAQPGRLRQLILLAPAGLTNLRDGMTRFIIRTPVIGDWLMLALFPRRHRDATERERDLPGSVPGIVDLQQNELTYRRFVAAVLSSLRGILSEDLAADHRTIHRAGVPVLAIWGRDDAVIPLAAMGRLTECSRNAQQEVIDGAGHGLPYTHTGQVLAAIRASLRDRPI